ncbi:MAG: glycosyltransferase [Chloroflexota bacterium]|nr:glycosyltransferase [Chloroflexota bacterium]
MSVPVGSGGAKPRAVVLVANPAAPYSRGLRIARALVEEGYAVEIAAVAVPGVPDGEWDGAIEIRRYRPSGPLAFMAASYPGTVLTPGTDVAEVPVDDSEESTPTGTSRTTAASRLAAALPVPERSRSTLRRIAYFPRLMAGRVKRRGVALSRWALWPHTVRGWWRTLGRELEPADLYHACGSLTIAPALAARDRARRSGRPAIAVYDAIDDVFQSNNVLDMPGPLRDWHSRRERRWAQSADARTTVNEALAARLARRWALDDPPLVVPNYPEVGTLDPAALDGANGRIRDELGLPPHTRIVLFQGRLGPNLGLDEAAEAMLLVPDAAFVLIGFGRWWARSVARDAEPRFAGRHFTLPARHPDELPVWTASADASIVPLPPVSLNQRQSTPNKFWESTAVGTPVVVGPGLPLMNELVARYELGAVARSLEPGDLAAAIRSVIDRPPAERASWRSTIRATAQEHFSWTVAAGAYRELVRAASVRHR